MKIIFDHPITSYAIISVLFCSHTSGSINNNTVNQNGTTYSDSPITSYSYQPPSQTSSTYVPSCDDPTLPKNIALASFSGIVFVLGFLGNIAVILVIQYSQLRKQPGYVLVTSLASADLGVSIFVTTTKIKQYLQNGYFCSSLGNCVLQNFTDGLFPTASITHLLFICINRFCAITSPYTYHSLVTHTREIVVVLGVWMYCLLWTFAGMITWHTNPTFAINVISDGLHRICYTHNALFYVCAAIFVFIVPVIIAGILYMIIVCIAIEKLQSTPSVKGQDMSSVDKCLTAACPQPNQVQRRSSSAKGAKTLIMVFTAWVICWMPHFLLILVNFWSPKVIVRFQENYTGLSEFIATIVSDVLPCFNSCINPLVYFFSSSTFRHALRDSWLKLQKKPRYRAGSVNIVKVRTFKRQISDSVKMISSLIPSRTNF